MSIEKKHILLGVTSSVSIYKALELVRELRKRGAEVRVVMTKAATNFIPPLLFETLSNNRVSVDLFSRESGWEMDHIANARWADVYLIAPATANTIGKCAHGIADDMVSTLFLSCERQVFVAPAMNTAMFEHPVHKMNLIRLERLGVRIIPSEQGELACGEEGIGRLASVHAIVSSIETFFATRDDLKGKKILVTAGPTREFIDPVRYISNPSSGKMGYAIAEAAAQRGAKTLLVTGPVNERVPANVEAVRVMNANEMKSEVMKRARFQDALVFSAAVVDYTPKTQSQEKIKKTAEALTLDLIRTPDISAEVAKKKKPGQVIVGFAAESENVVENARKKLKDKHYDLIVANDISRVDIGFGSDDNEVYVIQRGRKSELLPKMTKKEVATHILDQVSRRLTSETGKRK